MSGLGLGLVDPGLVDFHRVGPDAEGSVQKDILQSRTQRIPQGVLTASMTVKVHQHLDDGGITCDNILRLLYLQSNIITHRQVVLLITSQSQGFTVCLRCIVCVYIT